MSTDFIFFGNNHISIDSALISLIPKYQGHSSISNKIYEQQTIRYYNMLKSKHVGKIGEHIHKTELICIKMTQRIHKCISNKLNK